MKSKCVSLSPLFEMFPFHVGHHLGSRQGVCVAAASWFCVILFFLCVLFSFGRISLRAKAVVPRISESNYRRYEWRSDSEECQ